MDLYSSQSSSTSGLSQATDNEVTVLVVPNEDEMNQVAGLLRSFVDQGQHNLAGFKAVQHIQGIFQRLEALHDNIENEKAVLYNKLHRPLEHFIEIKYIEGNVRYDFRRRAAKLLSVWSRSLKRSEKATQSPATVKYPSPAATPPGVLFLPRSLSTTPELDEDEDEVEEHLNLMHKEAVSRKPLLTFDASALSRRNYTQSIEQMSQSCGKGRTAHSEPSSPETGHIYSDPSERASSRKQASWVPTTTGLPRKSSAVEHSVQPNPESETDMDLSSKVRHSLRATKRRRVTSTFPTQTDISNQALNQKTPRQSRQKHVLTGLSTEQPLEARTRRKHIGLTSVTLDKQHEEDEFVRKSDVERLVLARTSDDDFVSDICDIADHYTKIVHLEAENDLLKRRNVDLRRRNVALEGERARFKAFARQAKYGEPGPGWESRERPLDDLVRELLIEPDLG